MKIQKVRVWLQKYALTLVGYAGMFIDLGNGFGFRQKYGQEWAGPITNHVGDIIWGFWAGYLGKTFELFLKWSNVEKRTSEILGYVVTVILGIGVVMAELSGIKNTPDPLDLPGIPIGIFTGRTAAETNMTGIRNVLRSMRILQ